MCSFIDINFPKCRFAYSELHFAVLGLHFAVLKSTSGNTELKFTVLKSTSGNIELKFTVLKFQNATNKKYLFPAQ